MATKAQEREALEKIMKIVDDLGDNSYIEMAFEGCFEMASENIELDFGNSPKDKWEKAELEKESYKCAYNEAKDYVELEKKKNEKLNDMLTAMGQRKDELEKSLYEAVTANVKMREVQKEMQEKLEAQETEIIRLKARLFDLLDM